MARYNDVWRFLTQLVECPACGSKNRAFLSESPAISPRCGKCKTALPSDLAGPPDIDHDKLIHDQNGMPLPPLPLTRGRVVLRELGSFIIRGNFRTAWERALEREQSERAVTCHGAICREIELDKMRKAEIERQRVAAAERATRLEEEARERRRRAAEVIERERSAAAHRAWEADQAARRAREAESVRVQAEQMRRQEQEWRDSEAGRLSAKLVNIHYLTGREFELFLEEVFKVKGYTVEVTQESCDHGVDLIVILPDRRRLAIQAKNQSADVGNSAVQEVFSGKAFYECHLAVVISRSEFTGHAKKAAEKLGVRLCGLDEVGEFLKCGVWREL